MRTSKTVLLSVLLFFTLFSNVAPVFADDNYDFFKNLFADQVQSQKDGVPSTSGFHQDSNEVLAADPSANTSGIKTFKAGPWLVINGNKNKDSSGNVVDLFWHIVKNTGGQRDTTGGTPDVASFVVRLGYKDATGKQIYAVQTIPDRYTLPLDGQGNVIDSLIENSKKELSSILFYIDAANKDVSSWWAKIGAGLGALTCAAGAVGTAGATTLGIGACAVVGGTIVKNVGGIFTNSQSWMLVTHQQPTALVTFKDPVPYNTPMTADFWYCAGNSDNVPQKDSAGNPTNYAKDGSRAPRGPGVEYFTEDGTWTDINGDHTGGQAYDVAQGQRPCADRTTIVASAGYGTQSGTSQIASTWSKDVTAAFQIGQTITFMSPGSLTDATQQNTQTLAGAVQGTSDQRKNATDADLPGCNILNGVQIPLISSGEGSFLGCVAQLFYYGIYSPIQWFAGIMGKVFDFFLGYSLSDSAYRADFVVSAWRVIRDISNIFFIIILVWTGLSAIFGFEKFSMKKVVPNLIINALIINFSLFITQLAIDTSNIFARVFYNAITVQQTDPTTGQLVASPPGPGGYKQLSVKMVSIFNPQTIVSTADTSVDSLPSAISRNAQLQDHNKSDYAAYFILLSAISAFIMFGVAMMFWKTAFFFLGRVVGLYITMIFSPFAFLTRGGIPLLGDIKRLRWNDWASDLTNYALLAPIFVFFLYVVYFIANSPFLKSIRTEIFANGDLIPRILSIVIPMLILYFFIKSGVDIAKKYSGFVGDMVQESIQKITGGIGGVVGTGVGLAAGGAAVVTRGVASVGGKAANAVGLTGWAAANADSNNIAKYTNKFLRWSQTSSMDARNLEMKVGGKEFTLGGTISKGVGTLSGGKEKYTDKLSDALGIGQKQYLGGNVKIRKNRDERLTKQRKELMSFDHLTKEEAVDVWNKHVQSRAQKNARTAAEEAFANSANPEYAALSEALRAKNAELEAKAGEMNRLHEQMRAPGVTTAEKNSLQAELNDKEPEFRELRTEVINMENQRQTMLANTLNQNKGYKQSDAYTAVVNTEKKKLDDKYGEIKDVKALTAAMRAEYGEEILRQSLWLKNGNLRKLPPYVGGIPASGAGGYVSAAVTSLSTALDAALGGTVGVLVDNYIKEIQGSSKRSAESLITEFKKSQGKGSKVTKLKEKIKNANKEIKEALELHPEKENDRFKGKVEEMNDSIVEEIIGEAVAQHQADVDDLDEKIRRETNAEEKRRLEINRAKLNNKIKKLNKVLEDRDRAQNELEKYESEQKKKEEGKGGGGKEDKKGE